MDRSHFVAHSPGRLIEISTPRGNDWAFIPDELPPKWQFRKRLWPLVVEAKEALGTLNGIGQTLPDQQLLLRPLQNREALSSSKIEGTFVTPEQLLLFEMNPKEPGNPTDRTADWMEVHNYGVALKEGCELLKTLPLCGRLFKEMHKLLMRGVRGKDKTPGEFRTAQVQIGTSGRFIPPPANEVDRLISNLEFYVNKKETGFDNLVNCFLVHYQFEAIHPFLDGNGRIGRAMLALMTHQWLGHSAPWLYMSAFYEQNRDEYMDRLYRVSTHGAWGGWIEFCLRGTILQAKDAIRRCNEFNRLKKEYHERVRQHSPSSRTHDLIDGFFTNPVITTSEMARSQNVTYPTAKSDIKILINAGILSAIPNIRPKSFYAHEVFRTAYSEEIKGNATAHSDQAGQSDDLDV